MDPNTYLPIPTCEIPPPILERRKEAGDDETAMPRVLLQVAGSSQAARRLILMSGLFFLVALLELCLFLRIPPQPPVVVYGDFPRSTLIPEDIR